MFCSEHGKDQLCQDFVCSGGSAGALLSEAITALQGPFLCSLEEKISAFQVAKVDMSVSVTRDEVGDTEQTMKSLSTTDTGKEL